MVRVRPGQGQGSCWPTPASRTASRPRSSYRDVVRGYLPRPERRGPGHPGPAQGQPGHRRHDRRPGVRRPSSTTPTPASSTASTSSAGAPTTRTSPTSSTTTSAPAPRRSSARSSTTSTTALTQAATRTPTRPRASRSTRRPTTPLRQHVPMVPIAHGGSAIAFKADVQAPHSSPLGNENFSVMDTRRPDAVRLDAERRADRPVLRRRDRRRDAPRLRAGRSSRCYGYKIGGTDGRARPRRRVRGRTPTLTEWTCTLREGVTFHDGSTSTPTTSSQSFARPVGRGESAPQGPHRARSPTSRRCSAGFLNPPARRRRASLGRNP